MIMVFYLKFKVILFMKTDLKMSPVSLNIISEDMVNIDNIFSDNPISGRTLIIFNWTPENIFQLHLFEIQNHFIR